MWAVMHPLGILAPLKQETEGFNPSYRLPWEPKSRRNRDPASRDQCVKLSSNVNQYCLISSKTTYYGDEWATNSSNSLLQNRRNPDPKGFFLPKGINESFHVGKKSIRTRISREELIRCSPPLPGRNLFMPARGTFLSRSKTSVV